MKNIRGIRAVYNVFHVTAIAVVGSDVKSVSFDMERRDSKVAKAIAAEALNVKPSKVIPSIELHKHTFTIDADSASVFAALDAAGIKYTTDDSEDTQA